MTKKLRATVANGCLSCGCSSHKVNFKTKCFNGGHYVIGVAAINVAVAVLAFNGPTQYQCATANVLYVGEYLRFIFSGNMFEYFETKHNICRCYASGNWLL